MGCRCGNEHSTCLALCHHFTVFAELFSLLFLIVSFQDSLTLEEPVRVSTCRVACAMERLTGIKPTLGCSGKAEG